MIDYSKKQAEQYLGELYLAISDTHMDILMFVKDLIEDYYINVPAESISFRHIEKCDMEAYDTKFNKWVLLKYNWSEFCIEVYGFANNSPLEVIFESNFDVNRFKRFNQSNHMENL